VPSILDLTLIGELAVLVGVITQALKSHPKVRGSDIVWWVGPIGIIVSLLWYLVVGKLISGPYFFNFIELFRACANGVVGAVGASVGYNIQKFSPIPNILPTATEIDAQNLKEESRKQQMVVTAVATSGVKPETAKDVVGLDKNDPPPEAALDAVSPMPQEEETIG
jgi:hypothetical protein